MAKAQFGTLDWAKITFGKMSNSDRFLQLLKAIKAEIINASDMWGAKLGLSRNHIKKINWKEISLPNSPITTNATEFCSSLSTPSLLNHCLRTFAWGTLLALRDDISYDKELFYLACLLHDLGLTEKYCKKDKDSECFAVEGALAANDFLNSKSYPSALSAKVAEAISLHLNVEISPSLGKEAYLLHEGAAFDVIGVRYHQLEKSVIDEVLKEYPRFTFNNDICDLMRNQAEIRPFSRANFLVKTLDLPGRALKSPFNK